MFRLELLIFPLELLSEALFELLLRLLLLLLKALSLLSQCVSNRLFYLPFAILNFLFVLSLDLFFGVIKLVIARGHPGPFPLFISLKPHLRIGFKTVFGFLVFITLLVADIFKSDKMV